MGILRMGACLFILLLFAGCAPLPSDGLRRQPVKEERAGMGEEAIPEVGPAPQEGGTVDGGVGAEEAGEDPVIGIASCQRDEDCIVVASACGDCAYDVINRAFQGGYEQDLRERCVDNRIACDAVPDGDPGCVGGECVFVIP